MTEAQKKILCIEDDSAVAMMIAEELADRGFEVVVAHDGHEGFVAILKVMPDLVLRDIELPSMSGFEVLERLNALSCDDRCTFKCGSRRAVPIRAGVAPVSWLP